MMWHCTWCIYCSLLLSKGRAAAVQSCWLWAQLQLLCLAVVGEAVHGYSYCLDYDWYKLCTCRCTLTCLQHNLQPAKQCHSLHHYKLMCHSQNVNQSTVMAHVCLHQPWRWLMRARWTSSPGSLTVVTTSKTLMYHNRSAFSLWFRPSARNIAR